MCRIYNVKPEYKAESVQQSWVFADLCCLWREHTGFSVDASACYTVRQEMRNQRSAADPERWCLMLLQLFKLNWTLFITLFTFAF